MELIYTIPGTDPTVGSVSFYDLATDSESLIYNLLEREINRTEAEVEKLRRARNSIVGDFLK